MLTEIYCEKFKTDGKDGITRKPISFKPGLNIIEGTDNGSNSVGKSTLLLVIDFCFGGNDYVDILKDVKTNVGPHTIYFTFTFEKEYFFARKTDEKEFVYICTSPQVISNRKIHVDVFNKFLMDKYRVNIPGSTFRNIISRFMRIANRPNLDEELPLRSYKNETDKNSLLDMLKLYKLYEPLMELERICDEAIKTNDSFAKAQKYQLLPKITKEQYIDNEAKIQKLKTQAESLANRSEQGLLELTTEKAEKISKIKEQIVSLKRNRSKYYNQLNYYKIDSEYEATGFKNDFSDLTKYFDNVNLNNLHEIEEFHKEITSILRKELNNSIKEIRKNISMLSNAIEQLEGELVKINQSDNLPKIILDSYASIKKESDELEYINKLYNKKEELDKNAKEKETQLNEQTMIQISLLLEIINQRMEKINKEYYLDETLSPILSAPSVKKYDLSTPNDLGTGCKYKGMITLDTAILTTSSLPVIIHDSIMFVHMSYERVERTLTLYSEITSKQIFIAVDRTTPLNQEANTIINSHRRILLSPNGNELFGWYWGKSKNND